MAYIVTIPRAVERDLARLPRQVQERLSSHISGLAENPRPHNAIALKEFSGMVAARQSGQMSAYGGNPSTERTWLRTRSN